MTTSKNPFTWVEIYVDDMDRARAFYEAVLQIEMVPMEAPGDDDSLVMISFPWAEGDNNISGALCKMDGMGPRTGGTLVYFTSEDCAVELSRVEAAGGHVVQPKSSIGDHGFISLAMDTEGNMIGFHSNQ